MNLVHGTDPIEGSSLAISLLETFYKIGALTLATTHYQEIKNYALITDGLENASCEFDLETLSPTYRLLIGIPGKSNAFAICRKLGLPNNIIERATSFMNSDEIHIEELLKSIYDDKLLIEKEKEISQKSLNEIEQLKNSYEEKNRHLKEKEASIIENAKKDARKILIEAKEEVSTALKDIHKTYDNLDKDSVKNLNNMRNKLNDSIKNTSSSFTSTSTKSSSLTKDDIQIGMNVHITNLNQYGIITSYVNKSNQVQVQIGNAKMMVSLSNIEKSSKISNTNLTSTSSYKTNKTKTATTEINVIGYNVEEATFLIDKYLDDCSLAKLKTVRIVHGKGTGILRKGIHNFLKTNSHVKNFRLGTFGEGETGVTVIELK